MEAFPLQVTDGLTLTSVLMDEVICRYVVPQKLHSDQGSNLNVEVNQNFVVCLGLNVPGQLLTTHKEMGRWNDLIVQLKQYLQKWLESIIVIGTSIYRKLFSHIGHHCMSLQVIHHTLSILDVHRSYLLMSCQVVLIEKGMMALFPVHQGGEENTEECLRIPGCVATDNI